MRQRDLKPGFWDNPELSACGSDAHLLFAGLWCYADREGRCKDEPLRIRAHVFPYRADLDAAALIDTLATAGFVRRYTVDGCDYLWLPTFLDHQKPHPREAASKIPPCPSEGHTKDTPRTHLGSAKVAGPSSPSDLQAFRKETRPRSCASIEESKDAGPVVSYFCEKVGRDATDADVLSINKWCKRYGTGRTFAAIGDVADRGDPENMARVADILKRGAS